MRRQDSTPAANDRAAAAAPPKSVPDGGIESLLRAAARRAETPAVRAWLLRMLRCLRAQRRPPQRPQLPPKG
jgi:hypothetical protein